MTEQSGSGRINRASNDILEATSFLSGTNAADFARVEVLVHARYDIQAVTLEIQDDGPGFAPEIIARLGQPYVTTRPQGEGSRSELLDRFRRLGNAVLVASSAPLDQFVVRHPSYFFDASPEHALVNPDNLHILVDHVKCAAFELPFRADESFGSINVQEILSVLSEEGFVHLADGQWQWTQESYPADAVSLRSISSDNFVVIDTTQGERVIRTLGRGESFGELALIARHSSEEH